MEYKGININAFVVITSMFPATKHQGNHVKSEDQSTTK